MHSKQNASQLPRWASQHKSFAATGPRHQNGGSSVQISTETEYLKTAKKGGGHKGNTGIIEYFDSLLRLLFH